jgi:hypothetical protein
MIEQKVQLLLDAKDKQIELLTEQIVLLQELAEQRRLAFMHQCKELANHRQFEHSRNHPWAFFWYCMLRNVWPFSIWYHRFD